MISDALNHASIIDGIRLCRAERHRYEHLDMADLERVLRSTRTARTRLIATNGVFSMDGDVAPLREICGLAERYDALVMVDDSHATGFFGATGRGTPEHCGVTGRVDIVTSTLGKALGGASSIALGVLLVGLGALLTLPGVPGQGLFTMFLGLRLVTLSACRRLERAIAQRRGVLTHVNRLRARFGQPPLLPPRAA